MLWIKLKLCAIFFWLELWKLNYSAQNGQYKTVLKMQSDYVIA